MTPALRAGDRVLVTRLDYLGDVILSLPLVDAIRAHAPGVEVDYLSRRPGADLLAGDARFARVWALERGAGLAASLRLLHSLRERRYRAVIDLYANPRSAWLSLLSGAPVRVGTRRRARRRMYTHSVEPPPDVRAVTEQNLLHGAPIGVAASATKPSLALSDAERDRARARLAGVRAGRGSPLVGVHPGGKWEVKRWGPASFAALAALARERLGASVVVLIGPGEEVHAARLREAAGESVAYLPVMPVRETAAVIAELDAMVVSDGGVAHLAVAVGTPTVAVFGSAEPDVWFPYEAFGPYRAALVPLQCRPCHAHVCPLGHTRCLTGLASEDVFGRLCEVLALAGRGSSREAT